MKGPLLLLHQMLQPWELKNNRIPPSFLYCFYLFGPSFLDCFFLIWTIVLLFWLFLLNLILQDLILWSVLLCCLLQLSRTCFFYDFIMSKIYFKMSRMCFFSINQAAQFMRASPQARGPTNLRSGPVWPATCGPNAGRA